MKNNFVGEIIFNLRDKKNINQANLCRGLIHDRELSRIENGIKVPNKMLLDAIFQRLGKSADRIEMVISLKEYKLLVLRDKIELCLLEKKLFQARNYLNQYINNGNGSNIERQYSFMIEAILLFLEKKENKIDGISNYQQGILYLKQAIEITFKEWRELDYLF